MKIRAYFNRRAAWETLVQVYGPNCSYCHRITATQIDHVIPYSYAPYHGIENLRPCCPECNLLAGAEVYETFEDKYDALRLKRLKRKHKSRKLLICRDCQLPYFSSIHSNPIMCPECADEFCDGSSYNERAWRDWLHTITLAGWHIDAHRQLREIMVANPNTSIPVKDKIAIVQGFYPDTEETLAVLSQY